MYRFKSIKSLLCVLSLLWLCESTYAAAFYTAVTETSATSGYLTNITEAIWTNNAVAAAKLGNQVTNNAVVAAGGNDYVAVTNGHTLSISVGTLLRVEAPYTFPGASLTLNTNVILYIQGVGKTNTISNLILNGGVVMNNDGNAGALGDMLAGSVQAAAGTVSYFCLGSGVLGTGSANHTLTLLANVTGSGDLLLVQGAAISATNLNVVSSSNPFSGRWIVRSGYLKGTGIDSLGTNSSFIVDPLATQTNTYASGGFCAGPSVFEAGYDINSAGTLTLTNGGTMVLHQSCAFTAVTINGTSLANGTYIYSTLANSFPGVFGAGGRGAITVQPYTTNAPPAPAQIVNQPVFYPNSVVYAGQAVRGTVLASGTPPLSYQWQAGAAGSGVYTNLLNQGNISGATSTTLTISSVAAGNAADYVFVVTNSLSSATSSVVTLVLLTGPATNSPSIIITNLPAFGSQDNLSGLVLNANPATNCVAVFIYVGGNWANNYVGNWFSKPSCASQLTRIGPDGSWTANIVSTGSDTNATEIAAFLVPTNYNQPCVNGATELPIPQQAEAVVYADRVNPSARQFNFSGYGWWVKTSAGGLAGPGPNYFSDSTNNVWVDAQGLLHLKITYTNNEWQCAEIISDRSFGYGQYRFTVSTPVNSLGTNAVLGMFTYSYDSAYNDREIDIEQSRWGYGYGPNNVEDYAVAPVGAGQELNFALPAGVTNSTHCFTWQSGYQYTNIAFQSLNGNFASLPAATNVLENWNCSLGVPPAGGEQVHINLWLFRGNPPTNNQPVEVIISQFEFVPLGSPQPARLSQLTTLPDGDVQLSVQGEADWHYQILSSSNLLDWLQIGTILATNNSITYSGLPVLFQFTDTNALSLDTRFYRTVTEP